MKGKDRYVNKIICSICVLFFFFLQLFIKYLYVFGFF